MRVVSTLRGASFVLCGRSFIDDRFTRYPRLPVLNCSGYDVSRLDPSGEPPDDRVTKDR
jgi:hypothetical protein